jgi:integrase
MADMSVRQALVQYVERVSIQKKGYVQEKYRVESLSRSFLGEKLVREVSSVDIATYRDQRLTEVNHRTKKTLATSSVRLEMSLLSHFFDICKIEWGLCDDNPVTKVRKPKPPPGRDRRLNAREERLILRYAHQHQNSALFSIVILALESAMRQGEILSLRWEHINLKSRVAHLPQTKNGSKRDVPLSLKAIDVLVRMGQQLSGKVFSYTSDGIKSTWRFMIKKLGIADLHFHDLRHEATSRLFELGTLDVMEVSAITGHKSLSMLKRYTHLSAQKLAKKLEGGRRRSKQFVLEHFIPYPALIEESDDGVTIRLLDFDNVLVLRPGRSDAIQYAQDTLLRKILTALSDDASKLPAPDQYLEKVDERNIIMLDPLAIAA